MWIPHGHTACAEHPRLQPCEHEHQLDNVYYCVILSICACVITMLSTRVRTVNKLIASVCSARIYVYEIAKSKTRRADGIIIPLPMHENIKIECHLDAENDFEFICLLEYAAACFTRRRKHSESCPSEVISTAFQLLRYHATAKMLLKGRRQAMLKYKI